MTSKKYLTRDQAIEIARRCAKAKPQSYYAEPFEPHEWVIDAIMEAGYAPPSFTVNGFQARMLLKFIDGDDECQVELADLPARKSNEGEDMEAGLYIWLTEYPEEGCLLLTEAPTAEGFCAEPKHVETGAPQGDMQHDAAESACVDIFGDFSEDEVRRQSPSIQYAWRAGRAIDECARRAVKTSVPLTADPARIDAEQFPEGQS